MSGIQTKVLEVRDRLTFIPVLAVLVNPGDDAEWPGYYLMRRVGYDSSSTQVLLTRLSDGETKAYSNEWGETRTMPVAHEHIVGHWHRLRDGDVVDVEFILGETSEPKVSERGGRLDEPVLHDPSCGGCDGSGARPGATNHSGLAVPPGFTVVERCDACQRFPGDKEAAEAVGEQVSELEGPTGRHVVWCKLKEVPRAR